MIWSPLHFRTNFILFSTILIFLFSMVWGNWVIFIPPIRSKLDVSVPNRCKSTQNAPYLYSSAIYISLTPEFSFTILQYPEIRVIIFNYDLWTPGINSIVLTASVCVVWLKQLAQMATLRIQVAFNLFHSPKCGTPTKPNSDVH